MKVLMMGHSLVVNSNRKVWNELAAQKNVDLDLIVPASWKSNLIKNLNFKESSFTDNKISNIYPLNCFFKGNGSFFIYNPISLFLLLWKNQYDVIIMNQETWSLNLLELNILKFFTGNRKSKLFLIIAQNLKKKKLFLLRFLERINTRSVKVIFCCCEEIKEVVSWKGIKTRCEYMPLSFDSERYSVQPLSDKPEQNIIRIGYLGRISEEKGIDIILQAHKEMNESGGLGVELVIAGGGPMQDSLKDNDNIEYMGIIPHELAYKFYEKIDVFVLASQTREFWKEQFGRVIIEAVASGKPVIGSSSGAVPEVMALLKMPYVFREDSVQELKACITKVGNDYHSGELVGIMKVSTHLAFEQFSHKKVALKILSFISEKTNV